MNLNPNSTRRGVREVPPPIQAVARSIIWTVADTSSSFSTPCSQTRYCLLRCPRRPRPGSRLTVGGSSGLSM